MKKVLKALLRKTPFTQDTNNFTAEVSVIGTMDMENIIEELINEDNTLNRETVLDIVTRFNQKSADLVLSGFNVSTGLVNMHPVINGSLYGKKWNPYLNSISVATTHGFDLRLAMSQTTVEILNEQADPMDICSQDVTTQQNINSTPDNIQYAKIKVSSKNTYEDIPPCGIAFRNWAINA